MLLFELLSTSQVETLAQLKELVANLKNVKTISYDAKSDRFLIKSDDVDDLMWDVPSRLDGGSGFRIDKVSAGAIYVKYAKKDSTKKEKSDKQFIKDLLEYGKEQTGHDEDHIECHEFVESIEQMELAPSEKKKLEFIYYDEGASEEIITKLRADSKKFSDAHVKALIQGMIDGSANGHSFIKYHGKKVFYVDGYLWNLGVSQSSIDAVDSYLESVYAASTK